MKIPIIQTYIESPSVSFVFCENDNQKWVYIQYSSKYAGGGISCHSIEQLRKEINNLFSEGSYLVLDRTTKEVIRSTEGDKLALNGKLTYFQQSLKTDALEKVRSIAKLAFGKLPELQCPAWEDSFQQYQ